jgi:hypothetical protein
LFVAYNRFRGDNLAPVVVAKFAAVAVGVYNCPQFAKLGPAVVGAAAGGVDYFGGQALGVVFVLCFLAKGVDKGGELAFAVVAAPSGFLYVALRWVCP